jgi:hypothetical protein
MLTVFSAAGAESTCRRRYAAPLSAAASIGCGAQRLRDCYNVRGANWIDWVREFSAIGMPKAGRGALM